ncbi:hypothetical protein [Brachybacterium hainanense]|uniref:DUF4352 domain-containing protein n=1 Tax=Brachybacterium hainanense TaxID=1541174 RepID=A0ABV6R7T8_9MICO
MHVLPPDDEAAGVPELSGAARVRPAPLMPRPPASMLPPPPVAAPSAPAPPIAAPSAGAGSAATVPATTAAPRPGSWIRRGARRLPTSWILTSAGAVLLASTAAFGGLAEVTGPAPAELALGEPAHGADLTMTVRSVRLVAEAPPGTGVFADAAAGEQVLLVQVDVVNEFTAPRFSTSLTEQGVSVDGITVEGVPGKPVISRADDGTVAPRLQPGVPAPLTLAWVVPGDALTPGEEVVVTLPTATRQTGEAVLHGDYWTDPRPIAHVRAPLEQGSA